MIGKHRKTQNIAKKGQNDTKWHDRATNDKIQRKRAKTAEYCRNMDIYTENCIHGQKTKTWEKTPIYVVKTGGKSIGKHGKFMAENMVKTWEKLEGNCRK